MSWVQILLVCYFLGMVTALLKAMRYALDAKRRRQGFYLVGVPANIALFAALAVLAASTGDTPVIAGDHLRFAVRLSFAAWSVLAIIFEVLYLKTFVNVKSKEENL